MRPSNEIKRIRTDAAKIRVMVNDDPENIIEFDPEDAIFIEKFYSLIQEFEEKETEYLQRSKKLEENTTLDQNGLPANLGESIGLLREVCEYFREKVDYLFGKGTSQKAFGDALSLDMFEQFFNGIVPFIQEARREKISKYTRSRKGSGKSRNSVMK